MLEEDNGHAPGEDDSQESSEVANESAGLPRPVDAAPTAAPRPFDVEAFLGYLASARSIGVRAALRFQTDGIPTAELERACALSDSERQQLRPLIEQAAPLLEQYVSPSPKQALWVAAGLYAWGIYSAAQTLRALQRHDTKREHNGKEVPRERHAGDARPPAFPGDPIAGQFRS